MTRRRLLAAVVALFAFLAVVAPAATAQESTPIEIIGIDLSDFPTVHLRLAASAEAAPTINGDSLQVTENGDPVEAVLTPLSDEVVAVLLAVDTSGSMVDVMAQAKGAADQLITSLPPSARVAIVGFGSTAQLVSGFTTERDVSRGALIGLEAGGGTAMYDAVLLGTQQTRASDADRTAMVLLTDGADSDSTLANLESASAALDGAVDDFYAIALETAETDNAALTALADAASGRVVPASDPGALAAAYVDLGQRIVNQYQVDFVSTTSDPTGTFDVAVAGTEFGGSVEIALPNRPAVTTTTAAPAGAQNLPEPLPATANPGILAVSWAIYVGAGLIAVAFVALLAIAISSGNFERPRRRLLTADHPDEEVGSFEGALDAVRSTATHLSERIVDRADATRPIDAALDRAGLIMRAGEFVTLVAAAAVGAGFLLYLLFGIAFGIVGFVVPLFGARAFLVFLASRRNAKFADQLGDTLLIMAGALRSGFGVGQAIDTVAEEMDPPISTEFQRALLETRLGRSLEDALTGVANRVQNEDFVWVVDAMRINRQVGGELATILDQVAETIRARNRLKRQVAALTAEGRISAYVLSALPVGIGLILFSSNPDYLRPLWEEGIGKVLLAISAGLLFAGVAWLRKMINIEY